MVKINPFFWHPRKSIFALQTQIQDRNPQHNNHITKKRSSKNKTQLPHFIKHCTTRNLQPQTNSNYRGSSRDWNGRCTVGLTRGFRGPRELPWFIHAFRCSAADSTSIRRPFSTDPTPQAFEEVKMRRNKMKDVVMALVVNIAIFFCGLVCVLVGFQERRETWLK